MRQAILGLTLFALGLAGAQPTWADGAIDVRTNEAEVRFAESLAFDLTAESDRPIVDLVLNYTIGLDSVRNRRIPEYTPGQELTARHVESLARGQIPPASELTWWWSLTAADGTTLDTPPRSLRYLDERFDWRATSGDGVRVWWYGTAEGFAQDLARRARAALAELASAVGTAPGHTVHIVTYRSRDDLLDALPDRGAVFESRLTTLGSRVAPDILLLLASGDPSEVDDVLRHELAHLVLHEHIGREYLAVPAWLDEGLAMYAEGPLAGDEAERFRRALREDRLMSLRSLSTFPGQADQVPLAYAQSREVVAWLLDTYGRARFTALLDALAQGRQGVDQSLRQIYGADQAGLYAAFRRHQGLPPPGTPAPRASGSGRAPLRPALPCAGLALAITAVALVAGTRSRDARREPRGADWA